jgi:hypothetical protein
MKRFNIKGSLDPDDVFEHADLSKVRGGVGQVEQFKSDLWSIMHLFVSGEINWEEVEKRINTVCDQY